jgi:hypothetical protein
MKLCFRLGLSETRNPIALFPLTSSLEQFDPLKAFQHIPFGAQRLGRPQTPML